MMDRRDFVAFGIAGSAQMSGLMPSVSGRLAPETGQGSIRDQFARLKNLRYVNAAAGTPMGGFAAEGARRFMEYWERGPGGPEAAYFAQVLSEIRGLCADLVGAAPGEIALVSATKEGEQLILDRLDGIQSGNIVTDDLHFSGSLHNYEGLRRAGWDVRVARAVDWRVPTEAIEALVDDDTRLIAISHVSNVNGHIADLSDLADLAHAHGAFLYADIIQSAGILPMNLEASGVDFAACNGYKWLYGTHGAGFLYVRQSRQGSALIDRAFPGHAEQRYAPWTDDSVEGESPLKIGAQEDARRYEPGHHSYIALAALYEGLKFIRSIGVEEMQAHTVELIARLLEGIDLERYPSISTHEGQAPIVTFHVPDAPRLAGSMLEAGVVVTLAANRMRVSPAIYNTTADVDRLVDVLNNV